MSGSPYLDSFLKVSQNVMKFKECAKVGQFNISVQ